jgi:hypothetical protein
MQKAGTGLYDDVRVTLALDGNATRDGLIARIDKIAAEIHPRDTFILFAAAHGKSKNSRYHPIAQDYDPDIGDLTKGTISQDDLQDWLANRIKARKG